MKSLRLIALFGFLTLSFKTVSADPLPLPAAIRGVIKGYMEIKNALVAGNAAGAQAKGIDLLRTISSVPDVNMSMDQHRLWLDNLNKLTSACRRINETSSIESQRQYFDDLSENLFVVLKKFHMNATTLYYQFSSYDKYYWISESAAIKNPYSGPGSQLTKGETRETLNPGR